MKVTLPKIGDIYVGSNGHIGKKYFFRVKSLTKSGNPRLEEFKNVRIEVEKTPSQSDHIVSPDQNVIVGNKIARFSKDLESWRVKYGEIYFYLYYYDPQRNYHQCKYY